MTSSRGLLILLLGLAALPASAGAQAPVPGQRIRVTAPPLIHREAGVFRSLDSDTLAFEFKGIRRTVPVELVSRLEVSAGRRRHTLLGTLVGAGVGLGAGLILLSPDSNACSGSGNYDEICWYYRGAFVAGGALLGAAVGTLIRTERWREYPR